MWQLHTHLVKPLAFLASRAKQLMLQDVAGYKLSEVNQLANALAHAHQELVAQSQRAIIGDVAAQVAHDIRSPLTALRVVAGHLAEVGEEKRVMIRNAVQRIEDIANDLAGKKGPATTVGTAPEPEGVSVQLLSSLIEPLISEKRIQSRSRLGIEIQCTLDASAYGLFARVQPVECKRLLSNVINNAVEAMDGTGTVTVTLGQADDASQIVVADTGHGIAPDVVPRLMQRGATFGKAGGSGLGLFHARTTVEAWGGTLALASTVGIGTTVTVTLPPAEAPGWFVPRVVIAPHSGIVVVDDDASIHHLWDERFAPLALAQHSIQVQHFSSGTEAQAWCRAQPLDVMLLLCDYELIGEPSNGLDLIQTLGLAARAILVTSHYDEPALQARCAALGVRLIPKGLAGLVPIAVAALPPPADPPSAAVAAETASPNPAPAPTPQSSAGSSIDFQHGLLTAGHAAGAPAPTAAVPALPPPTNDSATSAEGGSANGGGAHVLVIDDDTGIQFAWEAEQQRLGIGQLAIYPSMEACEAAQPAYAHFDFAFVDKNIPSSTWQIAQVITHLKSAGVKRVILATGENQIHTPDDPVWTLADGIEPLKVPEVLPS
ncbi:MAG: hybrid sensor histidine kinase/response regulator [Deltaproteobacteria bacterium]|nr:hybrid sensor histidine kinase/response regulator [Deltaproteobacteria bacterium]